MSGCVLRAGGTNFDVDGFLAESNFDPCKVFHRSEPRYLRSSQRHAFSGFNLVLSDAERIGEQISDTFTFLQSHRDELLRLTIRSDVEEVCIDFGCNFPIESTPAQFYRLPLELLRECAGLGVEIELSIYACRDVDEESG